VTSEKKPLKLKEKITRDEFELVPIKEILTENTANVIQEGKIRKVVKKKAPIPTVVKASIWNKYIGNIIFGKCCCCGISEITPFNFEVGHVLAESHGGVITIDNLRPICGSCNRSMGTKNMKEFARLYYYDSPILLEK
jgi:5-methylcytosine-specific restriction endonuclease McrA